MRIILITCMFILFITAFGNLSHARIVKYTDSKGTIHYTNIPEARVHIEAPLDHRKDYDRIIINKSNKYRLEPSLIKAVITAESNWDPGAVSKKGAVGLMQLMPSTAREMKIDPFSPEENIEGGTRYLRYLLDRFNDQLDIALAAYNAGPTVVEKSGGIPSIAETRKYVRQVLSNSNSVVRKGPSQIHKLFLKDGSVIYTNTPSFYKNHTLPNL
ncbi:MAG TPA: lytic transglycosylase domain-containing protein [Nitrospirae bacterium]|nr:lytic transglycosylase domain-containing protein [Nitrospirota bacterium]HDN95232.1 lytic transglycosylase domain-containing protein [Nitrospirota bacterium]HDO66896.1 lytic transglycosylase domain-containing protein [Nitrospirota bacterium]HEW81070.1 lytic transglycosylase domain-containing protein [Nitrospirota bacterium]